MKDMKNRSNMNDIDNDNGREIKQSNRKALPKFILLMILSMLIGGGIGYLSAHFGLNELTGSLNQAGAFFGMYIAHWLMLATAILLPAVCIPVYHSAKKLLAGWDGEDEEISDAIERKISIAIWLNGTALILSFFLLAACYSGGFAMFDNDSSTLSLFISIVAFFAILIEAIVLQQKCVDTAKGTNPEKKASVYDMKFQKKWMDSCDEAEKIVIGRCAFKAFSATNTICSVLSIVLAISAMIFGIGFLPSFMVCLVWMINQSVYCKEALRYSHAGIRIS